VSPAGGDEVAALVQFIRYDGKDAILSIEKQNRRCRREADQPGHAADAALSLLT